VHYDLNGFAISFMGNLYLLKKEKMALSLFMDQMELSATITDQLLKNYVLSLDGKKWGQEKNGVKSMVDPCSN